MKRSEAVKVLRNKLEELEGADLTVMAYEGLKALEDVGMRPPRIGKTFDQSYGINLPKSGWTSE